MKRKALATFFIACGCLAMVFGGTNVRADEEFTIDAATGYSEPHSMDPTLTTGGDQYEIIVHMEEGLMKLHRLLKQLEQIRKKWQQKLFRVRQNLMNMMKIL